MADQFVDLYEVLELPLDADRNTVRKRVNELYLEAQRNLDHRNFQTRVKYQELFEILLPQARYILLDEIRRDEYDRLVRASRASQGGGVVPPPAVTGPAEPFKVAGPDDSLPGASATLEPLPAANVDPEQLAKERDELWKKWKSGLQEVLADEQSEESKRLKPAPTRAPEPGGEPAPTARATAAKSNISFNFGNGEAAKREAAPVPGAEEQSDDARATPEEVERRRMNHRREVMKEMLVSVGLKWMMIGALAVVVPGLALSLFAMGKLYPRYGKQIPPAFISSGIMWVLLFIAIGLGAFLAARALSKKMRRQTAEHLAKMPYEELLRLANRE